MDRGGPRVSPILALQGNVIHAFENPNGSAVGVLRDAIRDGFLSNELVMEMDESIPRAPRARRHGNTPAAIEVHFAHLELLWAFIYGWAVLFEEAIQKPMMNQSFDGRILLDTPLKVRAAQLLDWASSLRTKYSPWPESLPSPRHFENAAEESYALKANGIFQQGVAFFLYHEFGHVRQRHFDFLGAATDDLPAVSRIEMEREADDFAYRVMVSQGESEEALTLKAWPILAAVLSSLYLIHGPAGVFQQNHPHLHHRVYDILSRLNFAPGGKARDYFHYLCATVLLVVTRSEEHTAGRIDPEVFETADDALEAELEALDSTVLKLQERR